MCYFCPYWQHFRQDSQGLLVLCRSFCWPLSCPNWPVVRCIETILLSPSLPSSARCCWWSINSHKHTFSGRDVFVGEGLGARCTRQTAGGPLPDTRLVCSAAAAWACSRGTRCAPCGRLRRGISGTPPPRCPASPARYHRCTLASDHLGPDGCEQLAWPPPLKGNRKGSGRPSTQRGRFWFCVPMWHPPPGTLTNQMRTASTSRGRTLRQSR